MSLKRRSTFQIIASFDSTVARVVQLPKFIWKRAIHDDYRLSKPWKLQLLHNEALEWDIIVRKLWIHHEWIGRPWNKHGLGSFVVLRQGGETTVFRIKIWDFDEKSFTSPINKHDPNMKNTDSHLLQDLNGVDSRFRFEESRSWLRRHSAWLRFWSSSALERWFAREIGNTVPIWLRSFHNFVSRNCGIMRIKLVSRALI